jgi:hypothetical protein
MREEIGRRFVERTFSWGPYFYPDLDDDTSEGTPWADSRRPRMPGYSTVAVWGGPTAPSHFMFYLQIRENQRADERTRTAFLLQLRVINSVLQGVAPACKSCISKPISLPQLALCCTVLRSRWCQSGVNVTVVFPWHWCDMCFFRSQSRKLPLIELAAVLCLEPTSSFRNPIGLG